MTLIFSYFNVAVYLYDVVGVGDGFFATAVLIGGYSVFANDSADGGYFVS